MILGKHYRTELEKFTANTRKTSHHWIWKGSRVGKYGLFWFHGRGELAHRTAYRLFVGPIPPGMDVHHECRVKLCVNPHPKHLLALSRKEHLLREAPLKRQKRCKRGHPLSGKNLYQYKGIRICRACNRLHVRRYDAKMRTQ